MIYTTLAVLIALLTPFFLLAILVAAFHKRRNIGQKTPSSTTRQVPNSAFKPSVTIYIPTLNEERLIGKKLDNLVSQTYPLHEVLIYDCSTDRTPHIVRQYALKYPFIKLIIQPERIGAARTFNQALQDATGDIIIKTDADVTLKSPTAIEDLILNFADPRVGGACAVYEKEGGLERYYRTVMTMIQAAESNIDSTLIAHTGLLAFRRTAVSLVDPDSMAEDTEEYILIRKKGFKTIVDPSVKAEEEVPDNFALRRKQRDRRAQGIIKAMMKNKDIFFNPKFGKYGSIIFPMELFIIGLSPFLTIAVLAVGVYLLYQFNPIFLGLLAIPAIAFLVKSDALYSAIDTQISGLVATLKYLMKKDQPLWSKVR